jgi:hypothetical protein
MARLNADSSLDETFDAGFIDTGFCDLQTITV